MTSLNQKHFITSWSGGKDACLALHLAHQSGLKPVALFNMLNEYGDRSGSHGLSRNVIEAQAQAMGLPVLFRASGWGEYESNLKSVIAESKQSYNASSVVFGDIDLEAHRTWFERVTGESGIEACFPLWKKRRETFIHELLDSGIETMIVSIRPDKLPERFLGKLITEQLASEIRDLGVCPTGEDGEFHTFVVNAPLFSQRLNVDIADLNSIENRYTALDIRIR